MFNNVQREAIMREQIEKENKLFRFRPEFSTNPAALRRNYVCPKLHVKQVRKEIRTRVDDGSSPDALAKTLPTEEEKKRIIDSLSGFDQVPRQKHKFPQTASQEIGWYNDDPMFAEEPLYKPNNNLRQCDVTLFAQRHIASKGVNPYIVRAADKA